MINEGYIEQECLQWFENLDYTVINDKDVIYDDTTQARTYKTQAVLCDILLDSLQRLNPELCHSAVQEVYQKLLDLTEILDLVDRNRTAHKYMTAGIGVINLVNGGEQGTIAKIIDFTAPNNNDFRAINQVRMVGLEKRRPDVVIYLNGLPVSVLELKNPADERADLEKAYNQIETYKAQIPDIFTFNIANILSDGFYTGCGSLTATFDRFTPWSKCEGIGEKKPHEWELETLTKGLFRKDLFIDYLKYFVLFEEETPGKIIKKIAGYHQFYGVRKAVDASVKARVENTGKCGVFWHTQGSGKSIAMICYVAKLRQHPAMNNPTFVVVTDRKDLDGQLYGNFCLSQSLVGNVAQAQNRSEVRDYLGARLSGGVLFTTVQKFGLEKNEERFPMLNARDNIIVLTDEAHRSQYGHVMKLTNQEKFEYGYSQHMRDSMPNAGFIGFTGTPINMQDKSTKDVFGEYVDIYDINDAVEDGATVKIYYENRLAKLNLSNEIADIDLEVEAMEMGEKDKGSWSNISAVAGAEDRVEKIALDITKHFAERQAELNGKAMIVAMSRENCVGMYDALVAINPEWHSDDINQGSIKVVMTTSADDSDVLKNHKYGSASLKTIEKRYKDPSDPLRIVIVRDMWLTGFDAPCMNTLYIDKPMQGHNLMQAIARVNRVFKDKPSGLVVDYIGIGTQLAEATKLYSSSGGRGTATIDVEEALTICADTIGVCREILHDVDYSDFEQGAKVNIAKVIEYLLDPEHQELKKRFADAVVNILAAYTLCGTDVRIEIYAKEIAFYRIVKTILSKGNKGNSLSNADREPLMRDLLGKAVRVSDDGILDLSELAGIKGRTQISILDDAFLAQVENSKTPNLALDLLRRLIKQELKAKFKTDIVVQKAFSDRLIDTINKMNEQAISTLEAMQELVKIAGEIIEEEKRGESLNLTAEEHAFYNAVCSNKSAIENMEVSVLIGLAKEIRKELAKSITVDWVKRDNIKAGIRIKIKRLLRKYKYPPDDSKEAIEIVLQQAMAIGEEWEA